MGEKTFGEGRLVVVDFEASPLFEDLEALEPVVQSPHAEIAAPILQRNPDTGGARLAFSFVPGETELVELRAQLRRDSEPASEVWLYRWTA